MYDAATETFTVPDGRQFKQADVAAVGWAVVLARPVPRTTPAIVPDAVIPPPSSSPVHETGTAPAKPKKSRRGRIDPESTPPENQKHYTLDEMRDMDAAALFTTIAPIPDAELFGALLLPYVTQLRASLLAPEEVAKYVLQARGQIQGFGGTVPPAITLLEIGQLQVLVERLFPDAQLVYRDEVVAAIGNALEAEDTLGGGAEEEDIEAS